jgi:hypothetical protein
VVDILIRTKSQDLWHPSPESIELWTLDTEPSPLLSDHDTPNEVPTEPPSSLPYHFPPRRKFALPSLYIGHSSPRCRALMLGPRGTALYICSNSQATLLSSSLIDAIAAANAATQSRVPLWNLRTEALAAVVLPTSSMHLDSGVDLNAVDATEVSVVPIVTNDTKTPWSCADYDEESGTVALGCGDGRLTLLRLGISHPIKIQASFPSQVESSAEPTNTSSDPYAWAMA